MSAAGQFDLPSPILVGDFRGKNRIAKPIPIRPAKPRPFLSLGGTRKKQNQRHQTNRPRKPVHAPFLRKTKGKLPKTSYRGERRLFISVSHRERSAARGFAG